MKGTEEIGCGDAYSKTCREYQKTCKGCKQGYWNGSRELSRTKCKMKQYYLSRSYITCIDCVEYESCDIVQAFLTPLVYKYSKYKQAPEFICAHNYSSSLNAVEHRKMHMSSTLNKISEISSSAH